MNLRNYFLFLFLMGMSLLLGAGCSRGRRLTSNFTPPPPLPSPDLHEGFPVHRLTPPPHVPLTMQPQFDPAQEVIDKAEASFQRGEERYNAGHLEMAKAEFNAAVAILLQAPASPREDKRLRKAFDTLVDRIHAYEVEALWEGDGFAEPAYQPAPLDELQTLTFPEDPQLSERVRAEAANTVSDLPLVINSQVASFIQYFSSGRGRATLQATLQRSGRFRDVILRTLDEEGVPLDLLYLAQAESGFQPRARSRAGAMGLWQFMPARGKEYGLERNWWVDERLNPEKATRAAARHLKDLYNQFGDWYLAMAAYNCGPQCVQRAITRTGSRDFWKLAARRALPGETRSYVPIILGLTVVAKNMDKYGFEDILPDPPWVYDTVSVTHPVDLRLVAEIVGTDVETIRELNPSLLRMNTPNIPDYSLRIPLGTNDLLLKKIAMIPPEQRVHWRWHTVRHGESLWGIAQKFNTSVKAIAEVNDLDPEQPLREAAELVIPVTGNTAGEGQYRVRSGDTLSKIAQRFKVSVSNLMAWNNLDSTLIQVGGTLIVGESGAPELDDNVGADVRAVEGDYRVRPGDTLSKIAERNRVSVNQLMAWNNLRSSIIQAGTILVVRSPSSSGRAAASAAPPSKSVSARSAQSTRVHRVRKGESLWQIASNYNTSVEVLQKSNKHLGKTLHIGDRVIIPSSK
ncbi:MAG: LysM peptidoglycan-binding domain-containing protein [Acidobacteria bacterium]|nr:LysM peptidoglycan-binding domain-containing protein [Acidobacteriota bacterium]